MAHSVLLPVLSYGADLFTPNSAAAMVQKMGVFWHRVQRWVTNCFSSTPINVLAVEGALPPIGLLLAHKRRMAAATVVCTASPICTAAAQLPMDFPSLFSHRGTGTLRPPKWRKTLTGPLSCKATTKTRIRTRLPLDDLAHLVLLSIPCAGKLPSRLAHLVPSDFPAPDPPTITWPELAARVKNVLKEEWAKEPLLPYYPFAPPPDLTPSWVSPSS